MTNDSSLKAKFKKKPDADDFDPKKDIDWESLAKQLKVKLVSYGGVHFSEAPAPVRGLVDKLATGSRSAGERGKSVAKSGTGTEGNVKLPIRIWGRSLEDGSMILVQEGGQVWLDGPEYVNISASNPQRFAEILSGHSVSGLTPEESGVYDAQDQFFRLSSEGEGIFGGYELLPSLLEARTEGLDLRLRDATKKPLPWVFGPPAGEGVKGQGKK